MTYVEAYFGSTATKPGRLQWHVSNRIPALVAKAAQQTGCESNAEYLRRAVIEALARDLGVDADELLGEQPSKAANTLTTTRRFGPSNAVEDVV